MRTDCREGRWSTTGRYEGVEERMEDMRRGRNERIMNRDELRGRK